MVQRCNKNAVLCPSEIIVGTQKLQIFGKLLALEWWPLDIFQGTLKQGCELHNLK
jgi:hypothetical protein